MRTVIASFILAFCMTTLVGAVQANEAGKEISTNLRARIERSPRLPFRGVIFAAQPPKAGWESGAVSGVATAEKDMIYEIQRGDAADPILVLNSKGKVLYSWGKGDYSIPHSIRIDPHGDIWTVDAGSSRIIKYSPRGKKLMTISVGGQPNNGNAFNGTTDLAFGPKGHIYIADGYGNARVLEYAADGTKVRQWGKSGVGPGEFDLPHSIEIGDDGIIYVADRENFRIEKFDLDGHYLGEISNVGRIYSLKLVNHILWASTGPTDQPAGAAGGWIIKLDARTGRIIGHLDVSQERSGHSIAVTPSGEPIITSGNELLWFMAKTNH
jgi:outer membrane protein assembly factor BamB